MSLVTNPYSYMPDPTRGRPLYNASIYVGLPDLDPETNPVELYYVTEDGTTVPAPNPVKTGAGGVIMYNGKPVQITNSGANYSMRVRDNKGDQVFYIPNFEKTGGTPSEVFCLDSLFSSAGYSYQGNWEPNIQIPAKADRVDGYALWEPSIGKIIIPKVDTSFTTGATFSDDLIAGYWDIDEIETRIKRLRAEGDIRAWGVIDSATLVQTDKIQQWIDDLSAGFGFGRIPNMNLLSGQVIWKKGLTIEFASGLVWKADDDLNQDIQTAQSLFRFVDGVSEDICFNCNNALFTFKDRSVYKSEHNHIFGFYGGSNITINSPVATNSGGDGFYFSQYGVVNHPSQITINNPKANGNRRNACSVVDGEDIIINNGYAYANNGTTPNSGWHIEPEARTKYLHNIRFNNCVSEGNDGYGFYMNLTRMESHNKPILIHMSGSSSDDNQGLKILNFLSEDFNGSITCNIDVINPRGEAYVDGNCVPDGILRDITIRCVNPNAEGKASKNSAVLIGMYSGSLACGGLSLDLTVQHTRDSGSINSEIHIEDTTAELNEFKDFDIKLTKKGDVNFLTGISNIQFDATKIRNFNFESNFSQNLNMTSAPRDSTDTYYEIPASMMINGDIVNDTSSSGYVRFLADTYPNQRSKFKMIKNGGVRIYPPEGRSIYPSFSNVSSDGYIFLTKKGESIDFYIDDQNNLCVTSYNVDNTAAAI